MNVLGVESSCDETAIALVRDARTMLSSVIASQIDVHSVFGGVVPEVAAREHLKVIEPLFFKCLEEAKINSDEIDAIAVTQGPGLIGALLVGVSFAKGLAMSLGKPLIPVDHVHAHIHGALLGVEADELYPTLALVVSGGHTNLYYMTSPTDYSLLACTIDDACGECFDKVAKLLGLEYPGGPLIEKLAVGGDGRAVEMPRMIQQKSRLAFSYSGLKTHMANLLSKEGEKSSKKRISDICASFQEEALGQLGRKISYALTIRPDVKSVLIAGGVAANQRFQKILGEVTKLPTVFPKPAFCSDNAAMIAAYGYHVYGRESNSRVFEDYGWDAYSRYAFEEYLVDFNKSTGER